MNINCIINLLQDKSNVQISHLWYSPPFFAMWHSTPQGRVWYTYFHLYICMIGTCLRRVSLGNCWHLSPNTSLQILGHNLREIVSWWQGLPETNSLHLKIGLPIGKDRIPTIHFQVQTCWFQGGYSLLHQWYPILSCPFVWFASSIFHVSNAHFCACFVKTHCTWCKKGSTPEASVMEFGLNSSCDTISRGGMLINAIETYKIYHKINILKCLNDSICNKKQVPITTNTKNHITNPRWPFPSEDPTTWIGRISRNPRKHRHGTTVGIRKSLNLTARKFAPEN